MVHFPLDEIYNYVLTYGFKIEELYRNEDEIRIVVYCPCKGMDDYIKLTGCDLEDVLYQTKHFRFSLTVEE